MIRKSYLFFCASIITYLLLLYIIPFLPYSNLSYNFFIDSLFLHIPSLILSIFGLYYGVKGVREDNVSVKRVGAIVLNIIVMVYLLLGFIITIFIAFMFFLGIPL